MDKLEKFILENREAFMDQDPDEGHFSRFEEKLSRQESGRTLAGNRFLLLKIAAGLLIVLSVSVLLFAFAASRLFNYGINSQADNHVPGDIRDAVNYYDQAAETGMGTIKKLACCGQDSKTLCKMASSEMNSLDATTTELTQALKDHPCDERIQAALIRTQQMKETVVNHMVSKMNQVSH